MRRRRIQAVSATAVGGFRHVPTRPIQVSDHGSDYLFAP
jgi:hypothetical protein